MLEILELLKPLAVAMLLNIALGTWYNVKIQDFKFDWYKLGNGAWKALLIGCGYIGLAYIFVEVPSLADTLGVTPKFIILVAIAHYTSKVVVNIAKIQGIELPELKLVKK